MLETPPWAPSQQFISHGESFCNGPARRPDANYHGNLGRGLFESLQQLSPMLPTELGGKVMAVQNPPENLELRRREPWTELGSHHQTGLELPFLGELQSHYLVKTSQCGTLRLACERSHYTPSPKLPS